MSLSQKNYNKLNENYLYKREPIKNGSYSDIYWCKNWTYKVHKFNDGRAYMYDTYFDDWDSAILVTDDNIDDFKFVFDFRDMKRINDNERNEFEENDIFRVATDSGGYSCGRLFWVKKNATKSKEKLINKKKDEIEFLKKQLKWAEDDLERISNN